MTSFARYLETKIKRGLQTHYESDPRNVDIADLSVSFTRRVDTDEVEMRYSIHFDGAPVLSQNLLITLLDQQEFQPAEVRNFWNSPPAHLKGVIRRIWSEICEDARVHADLEQFQREIAALESVNASPERLNAYRREYERQRAHAQLHHGLTSTSRQTATEVQRRITEYQRQLAEYQRSYLSPYTQSLRDDRRDAMLAMLGQQNVFYGRTDNAAEKAAEAKGLILLKENLTPAQLASYERDQSFEVVGCHTGKTYRIKRGRQQNIFVLDKKGREVSGICFLPQGGLCVSDGMLCQKIALETDETETLKIAIPFSTGGYGTSPLQQGLQGAGTSALGGGLLGSVLSLGRWP